MSELQPGMLALVIGYRYEPVNVGKIVTLDRVFNNGDQGPTGRTYEGGSGAWMVRGDNLKCRTVDGIWHESEHAYVSPQHLLPIRPEQDPLHEKQQQELHA